MASGACLQTRDSLLLQNPSDYEWMAGVHRCEQISTLEPVTPDELF